MILLASLAYALTLTPQVSEPAISSPQWYGGRVYTSQRVHVGARPSLLISTGEWGVGGTVQITVRTPW